MFFPEYTDHRVSDMTVEITPTTAEEFYAGVMYPELTQLAVLADQHQMSICFLAEVNDNLGMHLQLAGDRVSAAMFLVAMAAKAEGDFDALVGLIMGAQPEHNSIALNLLGVPGNGALLTDEELGEQLRLLINYSQRMGFQTAARFLIKYLIENDKV